MIEDPRVYVRVADHLRTQIRDKAGKPLPTIQALSTAYGCAPSTVRKALRILEDEGLLSRPWAGSWCYMIRTPES